MPISDNATYDLAGAFTENVSGAFYIETSALDGTDGLTDLGLFAGTFDDVTNDIGGPVVIQCGTDSLVGSVQAANLTVTVARVDDPGYWNPNNPDSPINMEEPGFTPMRPFRYTGTQDGEGYGLFYGFLRRATWKASTRSCELYCEDLLMWASRVYPTIPSTGPTTTGAAIGCILDQMGWTDESFRLLAVGDPLSDFSADASKTALQIIGDLLKAERGTVYHRGDGVFVYESRDMPQTRAASATLKITENLSDLESGIDLDSIYTRATVTKTGGGTQSKFDLAAEMKSGRADLPEIDSPYIPSDAAALALATDLVFDGVSGKPPITATAANSDPDSLAMILSSPLLSVFDIEDALGGTVGEFVVQRIVHTIDTGLHEAEYTLTKRTSKVLTVDGGALDGSDGAVFRY